MFLSVALIAVLSAISIAKNFDIEGYGDHSLWLLVNDVKADFERDTGIALNLLPEAAVKGAGCLKGIFHASNGKPEKDFGFVCCELPEKTVKEFGLTVYPVAFEPLAIIVHPENPVSSITSEQVRDVFSGKIKNWKELGGRNEKIVVVTRLHCKDQFYGNWTKILSKSGKFKTDRLDVSSESDMGRTVSDFKQSYGHLEMSSVYEQRKKYKVKILSVDGYKPDSKNLSEGLYPFPTPLAIVTKGEAQGKVMKFIEYLRTSARVAAIMKKYGMYQVR